MRLAGRARGSAAAALLALPVLLMLLGAGAGRAQEEPADTVEERRQRLEAFEPGAAEDLAYPEAPAQSALSQQTAAAYQETLRAYYAYRRSGYEHRREVFAWQSLSSQIIFVVVLLLVLAGIYFAAIQFHAGMRQRRDADPTPPDETEISVSLRELKVRSPVLGVIILTISLAFFYLYLIHIYPIRNVF